MPGQSQTRRCAFTGPAGSPTLQSGPSSATAFAQQAPALTVAKSTTQTAASDFTLGNTITYSYVVTNIGNVSIPAPITIADNYAATSCPGGGLAPGATLTCTGTHTVSANDLALGSLTNNATAQRDLQRQSACVEHRVGHDPRRCKPGPDGGEGGERRADHGRRSGADLYLYGHQYG